MRELTMVDLSVYTNHRLGICIITHPFLTIFSQLSFFRSFFFREVSVNDNIAVKLIIFWSRKCFVKKSTPGICSTFCWTRIEAKRSVFSVHPFFLHSNGWVETFYLFIFIWEVRIRNWSRNPFQMFYRDISEVLLDEELLGSRVGSEKWVLPLWCCIAHCIFFLNSPWDIFGLKIRRTICLRCLGHPLFFWQGHPLLLGRAEIT